MSGKTGIFSMELRRNSRASLGLAPSPSGFGGITFDLLVSSSPVDGSLKGAVIMFMVIVCTVYYVHQAHENKAEIGVLADFCRAALRQNLKFVYSI